ncbi:unnamed protein product [Hydatigera taeniaeformis]|uniref:G_PROTEIN_RECEP_F1_2 domain-containing protein n=1 Tax=Hydatigena taeniaeformis TaxID=6205 RepID=A0A0R3WSK5_HYDTA|nr:unnamed protein product [Hydatigera taeniaeformis]
MVGQNIALTWQELINYCLLHHRLVRGQRLPQISFPTCFLTAASLALGSVTSALTLEEALKDAPSCIFYDTEPYSLGYHAGLASLVTYGSLIFITASISIIARCTGATRRRRTPTMEKSKYVNRPLSTYFRFRLFRAHICKPLFSSL